MLLPQKQKWKEKKTKITMGGGTVQEMEKRETRNEILKCNYTAETVNEHTLDYGIQIHA
jgi:hypothetical protein